MFKTNYYLAIGVLVSIILGITGIYNQIYIVIAAAALLAIICLVTMYKNSKAITELKN